MAKQVIVMRKDLGMRKGKMISQGAHASLKVFVDMMKSTELVVGKIKKYSFNATTDMIEWLDGEFKKITVYVKSEEELLAIVQQAKDAKLPHALIQDNGHTEFKGVKTYTCCAIGPADESQINEITGELPLL